MPPMSSRSRNTNKKQMKRSKSSSLAAVALALSAASSIPSTANAFVPSQRYSSSATSLYAAAGGDDHAESSRRDVLRTSVGALFAGLAAGTSLVGSPEAASASYSAYANRERDWEDRSKTGGKLHCCVCFMCALVLMASLRVQLLPVVM